MKLLLLVICIVGCFTIPQTSYSTNTIPPLKQFENGTHLQEILCSENLQLIFKISDKTPACVTSTTAKILIDRQTHTEQISFLNNIIPHTKYMVLSWHDVEQEYQDNIVRMIWIDTDSDPMKTAKKSQEKPDGYAAIFLWKFTKGMYSNINDRCIDPIINEYTEFRCPWLNNGIIDMRQKITEWFTEYKQAGGYLDYLILDDEFSFSNWSLNQKPGWSDAIQNDPRFYTLIQQMNQTSLNVVMNRPHINHPAYLQWNALQDKILVDARNKAIYEPIRELYPDVKATNYNDYLVLKDMVVPEKNGHKQYYLANFGTHNSKAFYGNLGQYAKKIGEDSSQVLGWQFATFDAIKNSSNIPNMVWVSNFSYAKNDLNRQDYETLMLYLICNTGEPLLFWNPEAPENDNKIMHDIVTRVNTENGCRDTT